MGWCTGKDMQNHSSPVVETSRCWRYRRGIEKREEQDDCRMKNSASEPAELLDCACLFWRFWFVPPAGRISIAKTHHSALLRSWRQLKRKNNPMLLKLVSGQYQLSGNSF